MDIKGALQGQEALMSIFRNLKPQMIASSDMVKKLNIDIRQISNESLNQLAMFYVAELTIQKAYQHIEEGLPTEELAMVKPIIMKAVKHVVRLRGM